MDFFISKIWKKLKNISRIVKMWEFSLRKYFLAERKKFKDEVLVKHKIIIGKTERILISIYHPSPVNPLGFKGNKELFEELKMILNNNNID